jgi:hypothetical protein
MATYCQYLGEKTVESNPSINIDDGPKEYTNELVVVWDKYEVLVGHRDTRGQVDNQNDPGAYLRVTQSCEGAHEDTVTQKEELES